MDTITILDIGPITDHTLPVEPGVTILSGGNEAGKSTAIACVAALAGRDVDLTVRDGAAKGIVKGLGTTISIGGKRLSRSGKLDADAVEEKIDLGGLVDPKLKAADAATRHRIKALLSLTGQTLTVSDFYSILPEGRAQNEILATDFSDDPVEMAGKIKHRMDSKAKEFEDKAKDLEAQMVAKSQQYAGVDLAAEHDSEKLQASYLTSVREHEQFKAQVEESAKWREERTKASEQINASAEALKTHEQLESDVLAAAAALTEVNDRYRQCANKITDLKSQLEMELKALESIEAQIKAKNETVEARQEAFEQSAAKLESIDRAKALLAQPGPRPPSEDDVEGAAESVAESKSAIETGFTVRAALKSKEEHKQLLAAFQKASEEAVIYRSAAESTNQVLSNAVACETLKVIEGDLFYVEGSRKEKFARLSAGRRYQVAICEIAKAVSSGKKRLAVLPLDQVAWDGLDHESRDLVHDAAIEHGIAIVTGQIRDAGGPLSSSLYRRNGR